MIIIKITIDGQEVASATAKSRWELPEVISKTTRSYDHDPNLVMRGEEKVRDARGELTEVIVRYESTKAQKTASAA